MNLIRRALVIAFLVVTGSVFGTSYIFELKPIGNLSGPIVFQFYNESGKPVKSKIVDFTVSERSGGRWKPVWSLVGHTRLREITYGVHYSGLSETIAATRLSPGKIYGAFASDGSGGSAGRLFRFTNDGTMTLPNFPD